MDATTFDHDRDDVHRYILATPSICFTVPTGLYVLTEKTQVEHEDTKDTTADIKTRYI